MQVVSFSCGINLAVMCLDCDPHRHGWNTQTSHLKGQHRPGLLAAMKLNNKIHFSASLRHKQSGKKIKNKINLISTNKCCVTVITRAFGVERILHDHQDPLNQLSEPHLSQGNAACPDLLLFREELLHSKGNYLSVPHIMKKMWDFLPNSYEWSIWEPTRLW